jgi:hypothetical protein
VSVTPEDGHSSRALANLLYTKDVPSLPQAEKAELYELLEKVSFGEQYWVLTPENTRIVLEAMTTGKWIFPEAPYFLGNKVGVSTNKFVRALAVFGEKAPSIFFGDMVKSIPAPGKQDSNLAVVNKKRSLPYIPVYVRPIHQAAADWSSVLAQSSIKMSSPRKGRFEFANISKSSFIIGGEEPFTSFYNSLKAFCDTKRKTESKKDKGKKRAIDESMETEEDASPSTKRQKVAGNVLHGLFE